MLAVIMQRRAIDNLSPCGRAVRLETWEQGSKYAIVVGIGREMEKVGS